MNQLGKSCTISGGYLKRDAAVWRFCPRRLRISNARTTANPRRNGSGVTKEGNPKLASEHASSGNDGEALGLCRKGTQSRPLDGGCPCALLGEVRVTRRAERNVEAIDQG